MSVSMGIRLGVRDLEARLGIDRSTIWRWYRAGKFPAPHYISERRSWWLHEIEAWEQVRLATPRSGATNLTAKTADSTEA